MSLTFTHRTPTRSQFNKFKIPIVLLLTSNGAVCLAEENLALGRPYTFNHAPNYIYSTGPGNATDLTDGLTEQGRFVRLQMVNCGDPRVAEQAHQELLRHLVKVSA